METERKRNRSGKMEIIRLDRARADEAAPLIAAFRVTLDSYRGIRSEPDPEAGKREFLEFMDVGMPVFGALEDGRLAGYLVCRIEEPVLWVEHIYVREDRRRKGVASLLFAKAEEAAAAMGEDTVFNFVHPNNGGMIGFLRDKGYTVLNMIEIRKPYRGEKPARKIRVGENLFDY